jgi:CheY-like chemotaxis protein
MKHVLVVDDDPTIRCYCRQVLENDGYTVTEASNGLEAVEAFPSLRPDVIVMDILMPEKDGVDAILDIRSLSPSIKIIAMSGGGALPAGKYLAITQTLGVHGLLRKPFHLKELLDAVHSAHK